MKPSDRTDKIFLFKLKDKVKDSISGFSGVVTGRAEFLHGERSYCVSANKGKVDDEWIVESRLSHLSLLERPIRRAKKAAKSNTILLTGKRRSFVDCDHA